MRTITIERLEPIVLLRKRNRIMKQALNNSTAMMNGFELLEEDYPNDYGYYAVFPKNGMLCAGTVSNTGACIDASIEYDMDFSFDENLQSLYTELTESLN